MIRLRPMISNTLAFAGLLGAALAVGCGASRPVKYYTLESIPADAPVTSHAFPVTLLIAHITAPHLYRDDRIVYGNGPVQMGTYEYQRWAEPPTDMLESLLLESLRASGRFRSVERLSSSARGDYIVRGHLSALQEVDSPGIIARFTIALELFYPKTGTTVWTQTYTHDEPAAAKTVPAVVEALEKNVRGGMEQLTASLSQYFAEHAPQ